MVDYRTIYNKMLEGQYYSAKDLGVAPASMSAMARRGLVSKREGKPCTYCKILNGKLLTIIDYANKHQAEFFTLFNTISHLGMLCSIKNGVVVDCWGKTYDLTNVNKIMFCKNGNHTEYILEN